MMKRRGILAMIAILVIVPGVIAVSAPRTLKIGALANMTGWFSVIDISNVNELKTMARMINEGGGLTINGVAYTIQIDVQDGQSDATGIRNAAQILAKDGCQYVIETNDFWVDSALDIFEKAGIMNVMAQNNMDFKAISKDMKYSYTFCNGGAANYASAFQAFVKQYPAVKSVVYCQNDDGNNDASIKLVKDLCAQYGLKYVDAPVIYDANATDFSATALQVIKSKADAFIGNGQPKNIAALLKEVRNNGSKMVCAAMFTMSAGLLKDIAGPSAASNAFSLGADLSTQANNTPAFWKIYTQVVKDYGQASATSFTGNFANCLYVLTNLMKGARSVDSGDVMAYWNTIKSVDSLYGPGKIGGTATYGTNHLLATPNPLSMLVDGKVQFGGWFDTVIP